MLRRVHQVRGGHLFGLAMVAPRLLEGGKTAERLLVAGEAIRRLGTAFQIVDDLTDFEFDLSRRSHNLLVARIHHHGSAAERALLAELWAGAAAEPGLVEGLFADSARAVLADAYNEARASLKTLEELGFWFPPSLAEQVVHAIVGLDGVARMQGILQPEKAS
jgi:geranylgeranyl pyrophosphate synthase